MRLESLRVLFMLFLTVKKWIEYHRILGVEQFFITDDCSFEGGVLIPVMTFYQRTLGIVTLVLSYNDRADCVSYIPNEGKVYKKMYDEYNARNDCEWVGNFDFDEYVSFWQYGDRYSNLTKYLTSYPYPFVRLPWWVYGNAGYEHKPHSIVVSKYFSASLAKPNYIKSIAKTAECKHFYNPHFPKVLRPESTIPAVFPGVPSAAHASQQAADGSSISVLPALSRGKYVQLNALHPEEKMVLSLPATVRRHRGHSLVPDTLKLEDNNKDVIAEVLVPATEIFIKHYKYLSWEEFRRQRAATPTLPNGRKNYWAANARLLWEKGNGTTAREFRMAVSAHRKDERVRKKKMSVASARATYQEEQSTKRANSFLQPLEKDDEYYVDVDIGADFTMRMADRVKEALQNLLRETRLKDAHAYEILKRECVPNWRDFITI